jgi:hypothetical protein
MATHVQSELRLRIQTHQEKKRVIAPPLDVETLSQRGIPMSQIYLWIVKTNVRS